MIRPSEKVVGDEKIIRHLAVETGAASTKSVNNGCFGYAKLKRTNKKTHLP